jgi:divalent metal cation (Fe/Co/Zn/Cd) transporter
MHLEVDGTLSVDAAHHLSHVVKDAVRAKIPRVTEVTIHIEPYAPAA